MRWSRFSSWTIRGCWWSTTSAWHGDAPWRYRSTGWKRRANVLRLPLDPVLSKSQSRSFKPSGGCRHQSTVNETHDPAARSWVSSANDPASDFPIQNLPFGVFSRHGDEPPGVGIAIGDQILDVAACHRAELFAGRSAAAAGACIGASLNALLAREPEEWSALRHALHLLLRADRPARDQALMEQALVPMREATVHLPIAIGDYTDFYASHFHAMNLGRMWRPDNPLLPNYKFVPVGYNARASSVVVSGTPVARPHGQAMPNPDGCPTFGPTNALDYEVELGFVVGGGNGIGEPIPIGQAHRHLFGVCLVNDWSARDVQRWEYQPLGPFLGKSFLTSISPWIVTLEALEPYRVPAFARPAGDPAPLPYLSDARDMEQGGVALTLEVFLSSAAMRRAGMPPFGLSRGQVADMYWTPAQLIAHHTSNGCNLRPGDLLASGTISGADKASRGCLLEIAWRGTEPITLPTGESRRFLEDEDEVILRGYAARPGAARIGLGQCRGVVTPRSLEG
ncbi:MAG: fumarylacetoacetase [Luteitalea sp.]|nr:fumarylacetoacetase [Luteitalea sp.]